MSYIRKIEYRIMPENSFEIIRNCSGCGCKTNFYNTNCFRVNANGNKVDIWLIYQCKKCKHTYNLTIYERKNSKSIEKKEYEEFLCNSSTLSSQYGTNSRIFIQNRAEIDWKHMSYVIELIGQSNIGKVPFYTKGDELVIYNLYNLKVRMDRIISEILFLSRNRVKQLIDMGNITVIEKGQQSIIEIKINGDIAE